MLPFVQQELDKGEIEGFGRELLYLRLLSESKALWSLGMFSTEARCSILIILLL